MQLTNNLFLHHLTPRFYTSSPVFQEQCRPSSPPQCRHCRSGGAIFVSKNYGFFLQKLSMMTGEAKKRQGQLATRYQALGLCKALLHIKPSIHTQKPCDVCVCIFSYHNFTTTTLYCLIPGSTFHQARGFLSLQLKIRSKKRERIERLLSGNGEERMLVVSVLQLGKDKKNLRSFNFAVSWLARVTKTYYLES